MKVWKILWVSLWVFSLFAHVYAATLDNINVIDNKTINLTFDGWVVLPEWPINSEIKVLKDIDVSFVSKGIENQNKVSINLAWVLEPNTGYSLLNILGPEWNIDFTTGGDISGLEVVNDAITEWQFITKVVVSDAKTIDVYYNNVVLDAELEYKILSDLPVSSITAKENVAFVSLKDNLDEYNSYIVMLFSVKDINGSEISFDEDLYDFQTESFMMDMWVDEIAEPMVDTQTADTTEATDNDTQEALQATENADNIEEVALNAAETPETWAETTFIVLFALGLTGIVFLRKRFMKG